MDRLKRKAINFDLDTNAMNERGLYPDGYRQLGKSFKEQGFDHRQGSGYVSKTKMSNIQVNNTIRIITEENPWLADCVKKIDVTDIGRQHDLTAVVKRFAEQAATNEGEAYNTKKELSNKDREVISNIKNSKLGAEFCELYAGKNVGERDAADKKLIGIIQFFSADDAQSERIFKLSGLYRADKGAGYVQGLISTVKNAPVVQGDRGKGKTQYKGSAR